MSDFVSRTRLRMDSVASRMLACVSSVSVRMRVAAAADRSASFMTSDATTANPRPASPARAASIVAFSARSRV